VRKISVNVHAEDRFSLPPLYRGCNASYVTTSEGIVMIDTPMSPRDAIKCRTEIEKTKDNVLFIINTHHHVDHTAGNYFFPGLVVSHIMAKEMMTAPLSAVAASEKAREAAKSSLSHVDYVRMLIKEVDPDSLPLLNDQYYLRAPTITFSERLNLYVGEHIFELIYLPGHTCGHIGIYIPQERVFFAGDNFTSESQPSMANCMPLEWVQSLKKIEAMDIAVVVPGHGKVCGMKDVIEFRRFIEDAIDVVRDAASKGMSKEEAADKISFENLRIPVHPGPVMQRMNVMRLYEMLTK
jgi:cyclase